MTVGEHKWGLEPPKGTTIWWGARLLWDGKGPPEILWDRQGIYGDGDDESRQALTGWVDKVGLLRLYGQLVELKVQTRDRIEVAYSQGGYRIVGNPNGSYGYLYVAAYEVQA